MEEYFGKILKRFHQTTARKKIRPVSSGRIEI